MTARHPGTSRVPDILRVGLIAGLAGTAVEACTAQLGRRVIGTDSLVYDPARMAARLTRQLVGLTLTDRQAGVIGAAMRWTYGPSWAIAAAAVSPSTTRGDVIRRGLVLGGLMTLVELIMLPAVRATPPLAKWGRGQIVWDAVDASSYGVTVALGLTLLRRVSRA